MSQNIIRSPQAQTDIEELAFFLWQRSEAVGIRFLDAVDQTLQRIASMPGVGTLFDTENPRLLGLRCASVTGFRNYIIFYRSTEEGIEIVRVLHGARDLKEFLDR